MFLAYRPRQSRRAAHQSRRAASATLKTLCNNTSNSCERVLPSEKRQYLESRLVRKGGNPSGTDTANFCQLTKFQFVPKFLGHHRLRCQDIARCFQVWYDPRRVERRVVFSPTVNHSGFRSPHRMGTIGISLCVTPLGIGRR